MVSFPFCKINLGLHVLSKRQDGYHNIETCFYPVAWNDVLEIVPSHSLGFSTSGIIIPGEVADNICVKAFKLLSRDFYLTPIKIHLHKNIPTGAGLGGGSSDGAFALMVLNEIFELKIGLDKLTEYAATLGSDCAFFLENIPKIGKGRGEELAPANVDLKGKFIAIVKPDIHVSTADAYASVVPGIPEKPLLDILKMPIGVWKDFLVNDFEASVFKKHPQIGQIKESFYEKGAIYAAMSGSGAAVFGIFESEPEIEGQIFRL